MNKLPRLGTLVVCGGLVGACAQLIGLDQFDSDEQATAGESGDSGKGGSGATSGAGGNGGSNVAGGGNDATGGMGGRGGSAGGSTAGGTGGSTGGDAGMAGSEGGTGALGGGGGQGGSSGKGGSAGKAGTSGMGGTGGELGCSETIDITTTGDWSVTYDGSLTSYSFNVSPQLTPCSGCQGPLPDYLWVDFYTGGEYTGDDTGDFELGVGEEENYASCSRCVWLGVEFGTTSGGSAVYFFANAGSMDVDAASDQMNGYPVVALSDVTLEEVTVDFETGLSAPVNGGRCLHLASAELSSTVVVVPPEWVCADSDYMDEYCDCGCGVLDPACASSGIAVCDWCPTTGCAADTECHEVDLVDNSKCTGPQPWTCIPLNYGDGSWCDCGCGIVDLDCPSAAAADCDYCDDSDSCTAGAASACTLIAATDNSQCQ